MLRYTSTFNNFKWFFQGLGLPQWRSTKVVLSGTQKYVWRDKEDDAYKITEAYKDDPLELSHFLLIRTREYLLLQNKLEEKLNSNNFTAKYTNDYNQKAFKEVQIELDKGLQDFKRIFYVENQDFELPVAFATNTLYILTRNNLVESSGDLLEKHLLPLIKQKRDYLHGEGVAQTVYAL